MYKLPDFLTNNDLKTLRSKPLIFVVGNSRSGTTLMGRILGKSPEIFTFGEIHFFDNLFQSRLESPYLSTAAASRLLARLFAIQRDGLFSRGTTPDYLNEALSLLKETNYDNWTQLDIFVFFLHYECSRASKKLPCDHTPGNIHHLDTILNSLPSARVVNMIRDPRDVLFSQKRKWKRKFLGAADIPYNEVFRSWANYHPVTISKLWLSAISAYERYQSHERVYAIRFEDLISNPFQTIQELCSFLQIEYQPEMLKVPFVGSSHKADSWESKRLNSQAVGKWKQGGLNDAEIYFCQTIAEKKMKNYSYHTEAIDASPTRILAYLLMLFPKAAISLCLNLQRKNKLINLIKSLSRDKVPSKI